MRRSIGSLLAAGLLFVAVGASPAAADPPTESTFSVTFSDINPCTGLDFNVTIDHVISEHQHNNNVILHAKRTGSTDDGYVLEHGGEMFLDNGNVLLDSFADTWRNADTGATFKVRGGFLIDADSGEVLVDRFTLTCIGNPA